MMDPSLVLHSIEAACLEELVFDPEENYAQVLEEARIHAKQAAAKRPLSIHQEDEESIPRKRDKGRSTYNQRTAKVYFVPPPILGNDDNHASSKQQHKKKKKKRKPWSWMDPLIHLWRGSGSHSRSNPPDTPTPLAHKCRPRAASASGPLPLYTDGNGQNPRPWHRHGGGADGSGRLAAISCAGGAAGQDAASPYVPLRHHGPQKKWTSGPLYVTS